MYQLPTIVDAKCSFKCFCLSNLVICFENYCETCPLQNMTQSGSNGVSIYNNAVVFCVSETFALLPNLG